MDDAEREEIVARVFAAQRNPSLVGPPVSDHDRESARQAIAAYEAREGRPGVSLDDLDPQDAA